jgi:hypothetical protein
MTATLCVNDQLASRLAPPKFRRFLRKDMRNALGAASLPSKVRPDARNDKKTNRDALATGFTREMKSPW